MEELCKALLISGGGVAAVVLTPAVVAALGFSATGIIAGSIASQLMAFFSAGGVPGFIAFLQSFGAVGFSWSGLTLTFGTGSILGNMISSICNQTRAP